MIAWILSFLLILARPARAESDEGVVTVGSKAFTESVLLGEITTLMLEEAAIPARHMEQLGGTRLLWNALQAGEIDIYPEYSGTLTREIFAGQGIDTLAELETALFSKGLGFVGPLGFNNSYAIGMRAQRAAALGIKTISDLARHPELKLGFSSEFMDRSEGWPGLRMRYGLTHHDVRGMSHELAYRGLASGAIDATDLYATDAEIAHYDLIVLEDDEAFFPKYDALLIYRQATSEAIPGFARTLAKLKDHIQASAMIKMNEQATIEKIPESIVASTFINSTFGARTKAARRHKFSHLQMRLAEHLKLVAISLGAGIVTSIPLGIVAATWPGLGRIILSVVGVVQTIPTLALLVFMIPLVGIGEAPAVAALFLYSLLPIVRNTHQGLTSIPDSLRDAAVALGLPPFARLWRVELPLAAGAILGGIKTSAIINIGTATLGALVGAGGLGQPILTGIRLDDMNLILLGAVPAALLALAAEAAFSALERRWFARKRRSPA